MICVEDIDLDTLQNSDRPIGQRSRVRHLTQRGRYTKSLPYQTGERPVGLAIDATIRAALNRRAQFSTGRPFSIEVQDLRKKQTVSPCEKRIVLVVDASDSMGQGTYIRMKAAKGAALALLTKARLGRFRVGVVAFREQQASVLLPLTRSITLARRRLQSLPTGGATPLADGLVQAWKMIRMGRLRDPAIRSLMVLISDGEANVPLTGGTPAIDVFAELRRVSEKIKADGIQSVLVDTQPISGGKSRMRQLSQWLKGTYYHIDRLRAGHIVRFVTRIHT